MEEIVKGVQNGDLKLSLQPGCFRSGPKGIFYVGAIGRRGNGGNFEEQPWVYHKPKSCQLTFDLNDKTKEKYEFYDGLFTKIVDGDDIQLMTKKGPYNVTINHLKPEFEEMRNTELQDHETKMEEAKKLITRLEELGVCTESVGVPKEPYHDEWYNKEIVAKYNCSWSIGCDDNSFLYNKFDEIGLIEESVPQWYKTGSF